jgi:FkbM family methyltransferase
MSPVSNLVYDIGMHLGQDTDYYLRKGFRVVGIEADPTLVQLCKDRFQDAICGDRLTIISGAVAPKSFGDTVELFLHRHPEWNTISQDLVKRRHHGEQVRVPRIDMEDVFKIYGIPYFLKTDIEGADRYVLESLRSFDDRPRHVSFESTKFDFDALIAEMDLMRSLGYKRFRLVQQADIHCLKLNIETLDGQAVEYQFEVGASGPFGDDINAPWLTHQEAIEAYRGIFRRYRLLGDGAPILRVPHLYALLARLGRLWGKQFFPGWYDTHATT